MEKVPKKDLAMYIEKDSNVATIKGAFGQLLYAYTYVLLLFSGIFAVFVNIYLNDYLSGKDVDKSQTTLIVFSIILLAWCALGIIRIVMLKTPNVVFYGNDMYIKQDKDFYLKVLPEDVDRYSLDMVSSRRYNSMNGKNYYQANYWGYLNIVINGVNYKLNCSSLKKTKHYLDGFMNGVAVRENAFDGDPLQKFARILFKCFPIVMGIVVFCISMFCNTNSVLTIISIILFSLCCLLAVIGIVMICKKYKYIRQMHTEYYEDFVLRQPVIFKELDKKEVSKDDNDRF